MEKYVTNIKDLVIQVLMNGSEIKAKAESGDASSCFQLGMIHLLGIDTPINFKKASSFLGHQSLSDYPTANQLLGFIAECDGNYSLAFHNYANTESSEKDTYLDKVIKGRNHIQDYLKKLDLPLTVNKEISSILSDYSKGKASRIGASIKIAAICEDEQTCLEAAKNLFDSKDYISAIQWLKKGNIDANNSMYIAINEMFEKSKVDLLKSKVIQVVDLNSNSLLSNEDPTPFLINIKKTCDDVSRNCSNEWKDKANSYVGAIIKNYKDKEQKAYLDALAEENARKKKKDKLVVYGIVACAIVFVVLLVVFSSSNGDGNSKEAANKEVAALDNSNTSSRGNDNDEETNSSVNMDAGESGYNSILSERKLLDEDLVDKTKEELEIMRNSIYARYGYKFKREDLLNHFSQYSWYNPTTSDMGEIYNKMNENEKYNVDFIKKHE